MNRPHLASCLGLALIASLSIACGSGDTIGDPSADPPAAPGSNDPAFAITGVAGWYLVGNELTESGDRIEFRVSAPAGTSVVDAWVPGAAGVRLETDTAGEFLGSIDIAHLTAGEHTLLLAADGSDTGFAALTFQRSHPLYIVVSTDWDDADNPPTTYVNQEKLHEFHPELIITHFAAPYTFTDPTVTPARRTEISDWLIGMRDDYGDEIGLHIHPYCNFVEAAGLACKASPSTVFSNGDATGYTVMVAAYDRTEFGTLLQKADELFVENGLGKPTSFRAGGWTTDIHTLQALDDEGYVADTSALNWARMEEWQGVQNGVLYDWNSTQWSNINDTSQPYYPGTDDIQSDSADRIGILEVPDNGIMVDYVTGEEMIEIFGKNWDGSALLQPTQVSYGYHPPNFETSFYIRLHTLLEHTDQFLASAGNGPVVYIGLSDLTKVWQ